MGFSVFPFFDNKGPKIPYLFTANVYTTIGNIDNICVQSLKLPVMDLADGDGHIYLGNGIINVPLFNPASRTLEMTFEETDNMNITILFNHLSFLQYQGKVLKMCIVVADHQNLNSNLEPHVRCFICKLQSYDNVQFSNTGSPNLGTITATFAVDSEIPWEGESKMLEILGEKNTDYTNVRKTGVALKLTNGEVENLDDVIQTGDNKITQKFN